MTVKDYVKKAEGYLDQGLLEEAKVTLQIVETFLTAKQVRELDTEMTDKQVLPLTQSTSS